MTDPSALPVQWLGGGSAASKGRGARPHVDDWVVVQQLRKS